MFNVYPFVMSPIKVVKENKKQKEKIDKMEFRCSQTNIEFYYDRCIVDVIC